MSKYKIQKFPKSRIATLDVCEIGKKKHHIPAFIEVDVTESRKKLKLYKKNRKASFTSWLIKVIAITIKDFESTAGYLRGKRKLFLFTDINVSMVIEKEIDNQRVPIPLIIEKTQDKSIESITSHINVAKSKDLSNDDIVLHKKSNRIEQLYYHFPGFVRQLFWKYLVKNPKLSFNKMGNVAFTSLGMMGKVNGWFVPISVHPICFGISGIEKKPRVLDDKIVIREMLKMTILLDHDVVDGANMVRFISKLSANIENGIELEIPD